MNSRTKKIIKIIIPLLFGGGLIWYLFTIIPPKTLLEYFKNANYWWISLGLFFGILSHLSRAYRWKFMLEPMGYTPRFINSALAVLIGYFVNLAIPRAGEVSRASVMANYENIPFEKGFGTIVAERIADLIMMFLIIGVTLLIQFDFILQLVKEKLDPVKIIIGLAVCLIGGFFFYKYVRKSTKGLGLKIKNFIKSLVEGVTSIFRMKNKWPFIFHTVFIWAMYVLMFWATIPAIEGLQVPFGGILVGFIAGGFSIAATNGGIGLYPLAVAGAFTLFGVPEEPSTAFGSVMWAAQTAMVILFGGLSFLLLPICNKAK
ncbi:flippase-like domain-containing protein [Flavobacteriaceae bacterium]|nr:flippase-like domain-containing protein [Flavobacteriaceae bacterium]MDA9254017.1 flippase-like domain-containing protein [Flavobacteriaceae bacterium]